MKDKWVPAYLRAHFWAGMSTTQRVEGMNHTMKEHLKKRTSLYEFAIQFDKGTVLFKLVQCILYFQLPWITNWIGQLFVLNIHMIYSISHYSMLNSSTESEDFLRICFTLLNTLVSNKVFMQHFFDYTAQWVLFCHLISNFIFKYFHAVTINCLLI